MNNEQYRACPAVGGGFQPAPTAGFITRWHSVSNSLSAVCHFLWCIILLWVLRLFIIAGDSEAIEDVGYLLDIVKTADTGPNGSCVWLQPAMERFFAHAVQCGQFSNAVGLYQVFVFCIFHISTYIINDLS